MFYNKNLKEEKKMKNSVKGLILSALMIAVLIVPGMKILDTPILGVDSALAFWPEFGKKEPDLKAIVKDVQPKDKLITHEENLTVERGGSKRSLKLDNIGKNSIVVGLKLPNGKNIKVLRRVLRLPEFKDVEKGHWAKKRIELAVASDLLDKGRSKYFRPEGTITREKFAKLIARAIGLKPVKPEKSFAKDVPMDSSYAKYINYAVNTRRLMELDEAGNFSPDDKITRAEAITAICRLEGIKENWDMYASPFEDLHPRHKHARYISAAKNEGFLKFAENRGIIDADGYLTNAELAYLLTKTTFGKKAVAELLDWTVGYGAPAEKDKSVALK